MPIWEDLTSREIGALVADENLVCILPVGATEQHGPHLAVGTDTVSADQVARLTAARTGALVLPAIPYGCSLGHTHQWPGTLSLHPTTLTQVILEVARWAVRSGVRKLMFLSGHATNGPCLSSAILQLRYDHPEARFKQLGLWDISPRAMGLYQRDGEDFHANRTETSVMLRLRPHCVHMDCAHDVEDLTIGRVWTYPVPPVTVTGVVGRPTEASADDGQMVLDALVEDFTALVEKAAAEDWPDLARLTCAEV